jgi:hypothetical protein
MFRLARIFAEVQFRRSLPMRLFSLIAVFLFLSITTAVAQEGPGAKPLTAMPDVLTVPPEAQPSDRFDVEAATNAYLAEIPAAARARSDAYFEGGYWLILWDFLWGQSFIGRCFGLDGRRRCEILRNGSRVSARCRRFSSGCCLC